MPIAPEPVLPDVEESVAPLTGEAVEPAEIQEQEKPAPSLTKPSQKSRKSKVTSKPKPIVLAPKTSPLALKSKPPVVVKPAVERKRDEFDPKTLTNLPKPVKAPSDIELPKTVAENGQWIGSQSGITEPMQAIFRNEEAWRSFWTQAVSPYIPAFHEVPPINFSKEMVVGVFMGNKPLAGYQIRIVAAVVQTQNGKKVMNVRYTNIDRFLGIFTPQFQVQPFHLLLVPIFSGDVTFTLVTPKQR